MATYPVYVVTAYDLNDCLMVRAFSSIASAEEFIQMLKEFMCQNIDFHTCYVKQLNKRANELKKEMNYEHE